MFIELHACIEERGMDAGPCEVMEREVWCLCVSVRESSVVLVVTSMSAIQYFMSGESVAVYSPFWTRDLLNKKKKEKERS
jgi:hypothetical protein